ncbi:MAG: outer membrane beta-barrel protein [Candidatus Edwardsbacteria bacterium]|nr:outer membrane beta-barrel protein [Candidatus Edwardsbacteria bacterium]
MKKTLLILAALTIATAAFAADAAKGIEKGDKALLFSATGFDASGFGGDYSIGAKYYIGKGLALRPVLRFGYQSTTTKAQPDTLTYLPWRRTYDNTVEKRTAFGLEAAVEKTLVAKGAVNLYAGGGLGITFGSRPEDEGYTDIDPATSTTRRRTWVTKRSETLFKIGVIGGMEIAVTDNISLGGEYQFGLTRSSEGTDETTYTQTVTSGSTSTVTTVATRNPLTTATTFGFGTIGLVLGIRF